MCPNYIIVPPSCAIAANIEPDQEICLQCLPGAKMQGFECVTSCSSSPVLWFEDPQTDSCQRELLHSRSHITNMYIGCGPDFFYVSLSVVLSDDSACFIYSNLLFLLFLIVFVANIF